MFSLESVRQRKKSHLGQKSWSGNSYTTVIRKSFIMHWLALGDASFLVMGTVMGVRIVFGPRT